MSRPSSKADTGSATGGLSLRYSLLLFLGLGWAVRLAAIKWTSASGWPPDATVQIVVVVMAVVLTVANLLRRRPPPLTRRALTFYAVSGLLGFLLPFSLELIVAAHLSVFMLTIVVTTVPIWTLLIAMAIRVERFSWRKSIGTLAGFAAAAVIVIDLTGQGDQAGDIRWIALAFTIPVVYALFALFVAARWPRNLDALQAANGQMVLISFVTVGGWAIGALRIDQAPAPDQIASLAVIIVTEFTGLMLYLRIARDYGATFVSQANYLAIGFGAAIGVVVFGDAIGALSVAGAVGLVIALSVARTPPAKAPPARD